MLKNYTLCLESEQMEMVAELSKESVDSKSIIVRRALDKFLKEDKNAK